MASSEQIIDALYGIIKTHKASGPMTTVAGIGVGNTPNPENTIFITDKQLLFVAVPMAGEGMNIGVDISSMQSLFNSGKIAERGEEMRNSMTPEQILSDNKVNFSLSYDSIKSAKMGKIIRTLKIEDNEGNKYKYSIRKKEQVEKVKKYLGQYLGSKFRG